MQKSDIITQFLNIVPLINSGIYYSPSESIFFILDITWFLFIAAAVPSKPSAIIVCPAVSPLVSPINSVSCRRSPFIE